MEHYDKTFCLEVWGDYACFTRPEMKVERVSYDIITPSAARAVFEAIFWKPAFHWRIKRIEVLNPIEWINLRRNEVGAIASDKASCVYIEEKRQQRAGLFLKNVKYRIFAELVFISPKNRKQTSNEISEYLIGSEGKTEKEHTDENPAKYNSMFERRARKGQCFYQPYLGCREFSCFFKLIDDSQEKAITINETRDLGYMFYDNDYSDPNDIKPAFFKARLENGIMVVPDWDSEEVRR